MPQACVAALKRHAGMLLAPKRQDMCSPEIPPTQHAVVCYDMHCPARTACTTVHARRTPTSGAPTDGSGSNDVANAVRARIQCNARLQQHSLGEWVLVWGVKQSGEQSSGVLCTVITVLVNGIRPVCAACRPDDSASSPLACPRPCAWAFLALLCSSAPLLGPRASPCVRPSSSPPSLSSQVGHRKKGAHRGRTAHRGLGRVCLCALCALMGA